MLTSHVVLGKVMSTDPPEGMKVATLQVGGVAIAPDHGPKIDGEATSPPGQAGVERRDPYDRYGDPPPEGRRSSTRFFAVA